MLELEFFITFLLSVWLWGLKNQIFLREGTDRGTQGVDLSLPLSGLTVYTSKAHIINGKENNNILTLSSASHQR